MKLSPDAEERARRVRLILMDVDGVLTDGRIFLLSDGNGGVHEVKSFDVRDGVGITFAHRAGLRTGILTGRSSESVAARARELGMEILEQGSHNKLATYEKIREQAKLDDAHIAYLGDDYQDLPILRRAVFAGTVANAPEEIRQACHFVSGQEGGRGAVREILDYILRVQGKWDDVVARYRA